MADNAKTHARLPEHSRDGHRLIPTAACRIVSILHRISGTLMFLLMPFIIWMFDTSVSSEIS